MSESDNDKTIVLGGGAKAPAEASTPRRATSANALPIGTQLSEFEIVGLIGEGGFGIVYLADDHSLQRRVAIKEYMPSSLAMRGEDASVVVRSERHADTFQIGRNSFVNEARLLAKFDHPALLKVYRFWEANGTAYMAMPYYAGQTLRDLLRARAGAPPDEQWIRQVLGPVMDALELMHAEQCYHRDIAPDNIMLLSDGRPVLLDFGAARRVISDMTQALTVILKPGYAPIEQYAEMPGVKQGPWTDIYALAAVVYFAITGRTPPPAVGRMMQDSYEPLAVLAAGRYSASFLAVIDQCLQVKGEARPQSIAEMRQLLGIASVAPPAGATVSGVEPRSEMPRSSGETPPTASVGVTASSVATAILTHDPLPETVLAPSARPVPEPERERVTPPAAGKSRGPLVAASLVGLAVLGAAAFMLSPKTTPPAEPASAPPREPAPVAAPAPSPAVVPAAAPTPVPASPPPISLEGAVAAAVTASDPRFGLSVDKIHSPLAIGRDALSFVLHSDRSGFVYVLLWDKATARLSQIFPNELDRSNRINAGEPMVFPRPKWAYEADQPQGPWEVVTLVADSPRNFSTLKFEPSTQGAPEKVIEAALAGAAKDQGISGEAVCSKGQTCSTAFAAARFAVEEAPPSKASR